MEKDFFKKTDELAEKLSNLPSNRCKHSDDVMGEVIEILDEFYRTLHAVD